MNFKKCSCVGSMVDVCQSLYYLFKFPTRVSQLPVLNEFIRISDPRFTNFSLAGKKFTFWYHELRLSNLFFFCHVSRLSGLKEFINILEACMAFILNKSIYMLDTCITNFTVLGEFSLDPNSTASD